MSKQIIPSSRHYHYYPSNLGNIGILVFVIVLLFFLSAACSPGKQNAQQTVASAKTSKAKSSADRAARALSTRPSKVSGSEGIKLFTQPNMSSVEIKILREGTVVWVLDETNKPSTGRWYQLRTRSGVDGWSRGPLAFCSFQEAQSAISKDREAFEDRLRQMILDEAVEEVKAKNLHPMSNLVSKTITSPITPENEAANSYSVNVAVLMEGSILHRTKHVLELKVDLFLELDKDLLSTSAVRVKNVAIIQDKRTEEMPMEEKLGLLKLLPLLL